MNTGYNGEIGWSEDPMQGAMLLDGQMLADAKLQADYYAELHYEDNYPTQETLEKTEYHGESAYKLRLVDASDKETTQYYSEANGWLIGNISTQSSPMCESKVTVKMGGYEDFGGLKVPTTSLMNQMGMEIKITVDEVTFDDVSRDTPDQTVPCER